jgi:hypothetical protein
MKPKSKTRKLKGWTKIAKFLGQPVSVAYTLAEGRDAGHSRRSIVVRALWNTTVLSLYIQEFRKIMLSR